MDVRAALFLLVSAIVISSAAPPTLKDVDGHERPRRQDSTTTTTTPRPRPSNIFRLASTLLSETRDDTRRAFKEIGDLFNSQFTTPPPRPTTTRAPSTNTTEDGEVSSTTEPYRISRDQFNGILRNNLRGIARLFGEELRNAIKDSGKNVVDFGREFRTQIRPFVEIGPKRS